MAILQVGDDHHCTAEFIVPTGAALSDIVSVSDIETLGDGIGGTGHAYEETAFDASADLSVVSFKSSSSNLLTGAPVPAERYSAFARNRTLETTQQIHPPPPNATFASSERTTLSDDGRYAAYMYTAVAPYLHPQVFRRDLATGVAELISTANPALGGIGEFDEGQFPRISGNGRYVVYIGLIPAYPGEPQLGSTEGVFVRDTCTGAPPAEGCTPHSVAVSYRKNGVPGDLWYTPYYGPAPGISRDGRYVLFGARSYFVAETAIYLHDRDSDGNGIYDETGASATSTIPAVQPHPQYAIYFLDASGRYVAYHSDDPSLPGNSNPPGNGRAFLRDTCTGAPAGCTPSDTLLSVAQNGQPLDRGLTGGAIDFGTRLTDISGSGRYVAFQSDNRWFFDEMAADPGETWELFGLVRDTCLGAPAGCIPSNQTVSRGADGLPTVAHVDSVVRVSDDGTRAVLFGERSSAGPLPNGHFVEVLHAETGFARELGGVPTITGISPTTAPTGSNDFLLTISGAGFVPGARVTWDNNTVDLTTIFVSPQKLQARVTTADLVGAGVVHLVRVRNPGGTSDPVIFTTAAP